MIFDVRVLGLDVVKQLVIFHRAANNFEALPSSVGMEIFLNQVGCWNVDFEADIMLTYTSYSVIQMSCSPSTKAFQKNPRQWMMVGTSAINKCGWTPNLKDNGNITLIISQTESSNVAYNSQNSWLLVSTLVATKGCRCQHFLQWYWFAGTMCSLLGDGNYAPNAWGMQLQRGIKASNVVEVWPLIAPVYTNWHKKPAGQSTDIQHQIPASHNLSHHFFEILQIPQEFHQLFGMTNPPPEVSTLCVSLLTKTRTRVLGLGAARSTVTFSAQQKGQDYHHFPFFNGHLSFFPPFSDISTYWMFSERVLVIVIQSP